MTVVSSTVWPDCKNANTLIPLMLYYAHVLECRECVKNAAMAKLPGLDLVRLMAAARTLPGCLWPLLLCHLPGPLFSSAVPFPVRESTGFHGRSDCVAFACAHGRLRLSRTVASGRTLWLSATGPIATPGRSWTLWRTARRIRIALDFGFHLPLRPPSSRGGASNGSGNATIGRSGGSVNAALRLLSLAGCTINALNTCVIALS